MPLCSNQILPNEWLCIPAKDSDMEILALFLAGLILLDLAALRWGVDTRWLGKPPEWPPRRD